MIVLDTHAWIWWVTAPERLSDPAREAVERDDERGVCVISCWEVAMLVTKGRLAFNRTTAQWVEQALAQPGVTLLSITPDIAVAAGQFPGTFEADPADRMISATAIAHGAKLVTRDMVLRNSPLVPTIW